MTHPDPSSIGWARRVNRSWFVRGGLDRTAEAWMDHLAATDEARLEQCCETARKMCGIRGKSEDPKPWFYAGLFSRATEDEARRFLREHRVTLAVLPATHDDSEFRTWLAGVSGETRELVARLRGAIRDLGPER